MDLKSIEGILFLSYLTDYNISEIHKAFVYKGIDEYIFNEGDRLNRELRYETSLENKIKECIKEASIAYERNRYNKIFHLPIFSEKYPSILKMIGQPPPMLYIKGRLINHKNVAVIGTRDVSSLGEIRTNDIVRKFAECKYGIVSGLAQGIDSFAHKEALKQGAYTIGVMAHSLDTIYPKENYWLANRILDGDGALISEMPTGINRGKKSFVERNRLQSGLSEFVVPVEMAKNSGTMHTVNFCIRQGRKLILIRPKPEYESQPQYDGINYLVGLHQKNNSEKVFIVNDDFDVHNLPTDNKFNYFDYVQMQLFDMDKFREFLASQGFSKIMQGNKEIWRSKDSREYSVSSENTVFEYSKHTDSTILYHLGLQQAFRDYFNITQ